MHPAARMTIFLVSLGIILGTSWADILMFHALTAAQGLGAVIAYAIVFLVLLGVTIYAFIFGFLGLLASAK
jgi:hypothetical protein